VYKLALIDLSESQPNGHDSHNALDFISYTSVYVLFRSCVLLVHFFAPAVVFPFLVILSALVPSSLSIGPRVPQRLGSRLVHLCVRIQVVASHWSSFGSKFCRTQFVPRTYVDLLFTRNLQRCKDGPPCLFLVVHLTVEKSVFFSSRIFLKVWT
jgi:hypothetical protein